MDDVKIKDIYNAPISQKLTASRVMSRMNFQLDNESFSSNIYWCRFSYNGYDSWNYAYHSHSFFELHYCIAGNAVFKLISGEEIDLGKNEFVIFPSKTKHSLDYVSDNFEKFVIGFDIKIKESDEKAFFIAAYDKNVPLKKLSASEEMQYIIAIILTKVLYKEPAYKLAINELLTFIITEVARIITADKKVINQDYENEDNRLDALIHFMRDNVNMDLHTEDFAKEMNMSSKQINRLMKNTYGITTSEFFRIEKVKTIKNLLATTDLSLQDIAKKIGFSDEYTMGKTFKKVAGITPGTYRRNYHK